MGDTVCNHRKIRNDRISKRLIRVTFSPKIYIVANRRGSAHRPDRQGRPHPDPPGFHPAVVRSSMWLKTVALAFALCSCASLSHAAASTVETIYYIGEASTTGADGSVDRHTYLIARTSDQSAGTITERAVTFTRGAYAEGS